MELKVLGAQIEIKPGEPEENAERIVRVIENHGRDFDIFVFPEMAIPGYLIGDMWERSGFLRRCRRALERVRLASDAVVVILGSVGIDDTARGEDGRVRLYNAAHVFQDTNVVPAAHLGLPFWPKTLLANYREFDDTRHFYDLRRLSMDLGLSIESSLQPVELTIQPKGRSEAFGIQIGLTICEDAWCDDYSLNPLLTLSGHIHASSAESKSALLVNISASPFTKGKARKRSRMLCTRSREAGLPLLYVNALGTQNTGKNIYIFDGNSSVTEPYPDGSWRVTTIGQFEEGAVAFRLPPFKSGQPSPCRFVGELMGTPETETMKTPEDNRRVPHAIFGEPIQLTAAALLFGLKSTLTKWDLHHVVIGASGGVDSAVVSALMTLCLGPESVTLINMPSRFNSSLTRSAAAKLAENLGCSYHIFGIESGLAETEKLIFSEAPFSGRLSGHVRENLQARDRGARILAALAASLGGVFTCNANKSELTIGYTTLYGDAAGFLAPIGDLWKTEVYALARFLNGERHSGDRTPQLFEQPVIPAATLRAVPSAELSAAQNVEDNLGDPLQYDYHDRLFRLWIEEWNRHDLESTLEAFADGELAKALDIDPETLANLFPSFEDFEADTTRWWKLYTGMGAFKRVQTPPILSVSKRAFGSDHRESVGF